MRSLKLVLAILLLTTEALHHNSHASTVSLDNQCVTCHRETERLFETSVHHKLQIECIGCHGGDSSQTDKTKAHSGPAFTRGAGSTAKLCGSCHVQELAMFNSSRHNPATRNAPRVDCADCHGIHTVGAPPRDFVFSNICASCHGLEYLPPLPAPFAEMLKLSDDLRRATADLGAKASADMASQRRDIQLQMGRIVHSTERNGGLAKIPQILDQGATLKHQIETASQHH
jgi:hypothetical protein